MNFSPNEKRAGLLAPLFALRTEHDLGIGDLEALRQFLDWSRALGFSLVQLLPINETGGDNSPYNAISSHAIDPTTLHLAPGSPANLSATDFEEVVAAFNLAALRRGHVRYAVVKPLKKKLLERAFANFRGDAPNEKFFAFRRAEAEWLDDYSIFRALMEQNGERETWEEWPQASLVAARAWLDSLGQKKRADFEARREFFRYVQWIAHEQWRAVKFYAAERGVALMGDIPFGVSYYSADVFAHPEFFRLDWSGGAPPEPYFKDDEFTQKWGQNWGIPLYDWAELAKRNFSWWRERIRGVREIFHLFRIDHILGFYRIYAFPWRPRRNREMLPLGWEEMLDRTSGHGPHFAPRDDRPAENAEMNRREGEHYLRVILEEAGATRVIGEDLGTVPDYVRPNLRSLGIAGFKIPQWEVTPEDRVILGSDYERLSLVTYATHDHKPLRALWEDAFEKKDKQSAQARTDLGRIAEFAGMPAPNESTDYRRDFYPAIFDALFRSESWLAVVMITDLLGRKDRFNVPGTAAQSNWSRRIQTPLRKLGHGSTLKKQLLLMRALLEKSKRIPPQTTTNLAQ